jgi:hypothetical protein
MRAPAEVAETCDMITSVLRVVHTSEAGCACAERKSLVWIKTGWSVFAGCCDATKTGRLLAKRETAAKWLRLFTTSTTLT